MTSTGSNYGGCKLLVATVLAFGMLTTGALAHTAEQEQMCASDAMRLCSSEIPDVGRITACMHRQRAALSDGCKAVFGKETPAATPVSYAPAQNRQADEPGSRPREVINTINCRINPSPAGRSGGLLLVRSRSRVLFTRSSAVPDFQCWSCSNLNGFVFCMPITGRNSS